MGGGAARRVSAVSLSPRICQQANTGDNGSSRPPSDAAGIRLTGGAGHGQPARADRQDPRAILFRMDRVPRTHSERQCGFNSPVTINFIWLTLNGWNRTRELPTSRSSSPPHPSLPRDPLPRLRLRLRLRHNKPLYDQRKKNRSHSRPGSSTAPQKPPRKSKPPSRKASPDSPPNQPAKSSASKFEIMENPFPKQTGPGSAKSLRGIPMKERSECSGSDSMPSLGSQRNP